MNEEKRPKLKIPSSLLEKILVILTFTINILTWVYIFMAWSDLPSKIPSHFDFAGNADAWAGKTSILITPILFTLICIVIMLLSRIPQHFNYIVTITKENVEIQYRIARKMILGMGFYISIINFYMPWESIQVANGNTEGLNMLFMTVLVGAVVGTLVYSTYKSYKFK